MRTTIDLPDELFRRVRARAAMQGLKLKEYVEAALRESLVERRPVDRDFRRYPERALTLVGG